MFRLALTVIAAVQLTIAGEARGQEAETVEGADGIELAVYEVGNPDGPPIVFIHGFAMSHLSWEAQLNGDLADEFRLVALDLRGHGASDMPLEADHYTDSQAWADDLAAVIRSKELDRPVLVGWSYGGYVMADYLRAFGDEALGGLVFVGSASKMGTKEAEGFLGDDFLEGIGPALSEDLRTRIAATRAFVPMLTAEPMSREMHEATLAAAMVVPAAVRRALFGRELDNDDVLSGVGIPALVLQGSMDRIVRVRSAEQMADIVPDARLLVLDGLGHAPHMDDPERFNRELAGFVRAAYPEKSP